MESWAGNLALQPRSRMSYCTDFLRRARHPVAGRNNAISIRLAHPKELRALEATLKKIGKRAENLGTGINPKHSSQR